MNYLSDPWFWGSALLAAILYERLETWIKSNSKKRKQQELEIVEKLSREFISGRELRESLSSKINPIRFYRFMYSLEESGYVIGESRKDLAGVTPQALPFKMNEFTQEMIELTKEEIAIEQELFEGYMREAYGLNLLHKDTNGDYVKPQIILMWSGWLGRAAIALRFKQKPLEIEPTLLAGKPIEITIP